MQRILYSLVISLGFLGSTNASIISNGTFDTDISGWTTSSSFVLWRNFGPDPGVLWINEFPGPQPYAEQAVSGLAVGASYDLTWDLWAAVIGRNVDLDAFRADVFDGTSIIASLSTDTANVITGAGDPRSLVFTATSTDLTIRFTSQIGADHDYYVDNVTLDLDASTVPEPSTLVIMSWGMVVCFAGYQWRRRRRSHTA